MNSVWFKAFGLVVGVAAIIGLSVVSLMDASSMSREEVESVIKEYLHDNPDIIVDSLNNYQRVSQEKRLTQARDFIENNLDAIENDPQSPISGNAKGDITIVEFFDYSCGYCKRALPNIVKLLEEDTNVKVVFKELPILGENSILASKAALGVFLAQPEKYFEFHKAVLKTRVTGKESLVTIASKLGIDKSVIEGSFDNQNIENLLTKNRQLAENLGVQGTPAFVIGGQYIPGFVDYEALKGAIAALRQQQNAQTEEGNGGLIAVEE